MARPARQATCHPERKNKAGGLCINCYMNARHATPEGKAKRHDYYIRNKAAIQNRAKTFYTNNRTRQVTLATARTRRARAAGTHKANPRVFMPKVEVPVSELPRETPRGSCDRQWWKPTEKEIPRAWMMNT